MKYCDKSTKSADICGYELPTNFQNFMQKHLVEVKIFQKVLVATFFWNTLYMLQKTVTWTAVWMSARLWQA